jgi:hypothetical protein
LHGLQTLCFALVAQRGGCGLGLLLLSAVDIWQRLMLVLIGLSRKGNAEGDRCCEEQGAKAK